MKFLPLVLLNVVLVGTLSARTFLRPETLDHLGALTSQAAIPVPGRVVLADYVALRHDFPLLKNYSTAQIDSLIIKCFSVMSSQQLNLRGAFTNFWQPVRGARQRTMYHPIKYHRASVMEWGAECAEFAISGLIDLKGSGLSNWPVEIQENTIKHRQWLFSGLSTQQLQNQLDRWQAAVDNFKGKVTSLYEDVSTGSFSDAEMLRRGHDAVKLEEKIDRLTVYKQALDGLQSGAFTTELAVNHYDTYLRQIDYVNGLFPVAAGFKESVSKSSVFS